MFTLSNNYHSYCSFGAHLYFQNGIPGVKFTVWAPNAREVRVVGDFNGWYGNNHVMETEYGSGVWTIFIPGITHGALYKYEIHTYMGEILLKSDPYAFYSEYRPNTASKVYSLDGYKWNDQQWKNYNSPGYNKPILIYEVHLGSWKRKENGDFLNYRDFANVLINYVSNMGYTHIELLPIMEHPYDASWGYQITGFYSITSRYGTPHDFMYFIDMCHQKGIGVILDWVPGHFCKDYHGLSKFDGSNLFESEYYDRSENYGWGTLNFDFAKAEVRSFLISNAIFWFDAYHIDGLRVDAVANMLYLDYGKNPGEWTPNIYGGHENLEAIDFMKRLNECVFEKFPYALMIAEESTAMPLITKPTYVGGLGYNYKWNMGWMNDVLRYIETDPIHRKWEHNLLTFSFMYAFSENFLLPLSHDEVVHGKQSLLNKMPGDYWHKFAGLRILLGYMMAHPGKKLLFMGIELGQFNEWNENNELDWHLLNFEMHNKLHLYVKELNNFYLQNRSLWELDHEIRGFEWIDANDYQQSVITFLRYAKNRDDYLIIVCNFTPIQRHNYRIGIFEQGNYEVVFSSNYLEYGGTGVTEMCYKSNNIPWHNREYSIEIILAPLSTLFIRKTQSRGSDKCNNKENV
ncbi:MAG: glycogen-branching enzyme [Desulfitibacter sp. BRH_c19]|nr:MAG: glycogen-branching enzyme [Desulfitibacter sp. BRH_c19]